MRTAIVGAGPTGLFLGTALARRGHRVTVVDRDPGPATDGSWARRGVMQFHHAHAFRGQVVDAIDTEVPEAGRRWREAGAAAVTMPGSQGDLPLGMCSRRQTFETALRRTAEEQPGLEIRVGHVDAVSATRGRADGVRVDGVHLPADLVVDASGRSSRVTRGLRAPATVGGPCGIAYVDRQYRLREGAEPGPLVNPLTWQATFDGYQVLIFVHERGIFSVLLIRATADRSLVALRHEAAFEAACRVIPGLSEWTAPDRSRPLTDVLPGGLLMNWFRDQRGADGQLALPGLLFVGDSVCTTTPNFGRGITTSLLQAREVLRLLDEHGTDLVTVAESFDAWSATHMRPWVEDHVLMDESLRRRWAGEDVDLSGRLPSDLIMAAAEVDPAIGAGIGPYLAMQAGPSSLDAVEPLARAVLETGWRPAPAAGPARAELVEVVAAAVPA